MSQRSRGEMNLAEAARAQEVHLVAERLAAGDDVDTQDSQGNTALHWACLLGLQGLSSLLLAHDARTDIPNLNGSYAVHAAAAGKNIKAMKMLTGDKNVHTSKDVLFQQDRKGYTAFLIAAENNDVFTMEWLYFQGVSLEQRGANGESAALITSRLGHTRGLQWLISHNASIFERDNDGRNALHLACAHGRHDSIKMLMDSTSTKSLQCVDTMGDGAISLAWKHGQLHVFCWLWFVEFAEALADTLSLKSSVRAALSRSAWTTVFWTLLLLNFLTFLALLEPAGTEAMLWLALLSCVVCCWWHLSMSDPGFTGPRPKGRSKAASARLQREAKSLDKDPPPFIRVAHEAGEFRWHFLMQGPGDTPFEGGVYWGELDFPKDYPYSPPLVRFRTPNGRFQVDSWLCRTQMDYHPEGWQPAWTLSGFLLALLTLLCAGNDSFTSGMVQPSTTDAEKRTLAEASGTFNAQHPEFPKELFKS